MAWSPEAEDDAAAAFRSVNNMLRCVLTLLWSTGIYGLFRRVNGGWRRHQRVPRTRYILPNDVVSHNTRHRQFVANFRGRPQRRIPTENFCSRDETIRSLELSFLGPFVAGNFRSRGTKVPGNFRSLDLSFRETFVSRTFRSQERSFPRPLYKALAMNRRQL